MGRSGALTWEERKRWLLGRGLDAFRLTAMFGVVLILAAGPFLLLELGRFGCQTTLVDSDGVSAIRDISWNYAIVAMVALLSVTLFCVNALPHYPDNWAEFALALGTALLPMLWAPMILGLVASPECGDAALLLDPSVASRTLPSGTVALTTDDSVAEEAGRVMALGVLLVGIGSTCLVVFLAVEATVAGRPLGTDKLVSFGVMVVALLVYLGGGIAINNASHLTEDRWASNPVNSRATESACTSGSSRVFDRVVAGEDRDAIAMLNDSAWSLALLTLVLVLLIVLYDRIALDGTVTPVVVAVCGGLFALVHLLVSITVSELVYVGSNPVCARSTLGGDREAARGLVSLACVPVPAAPSR